MNRVALSAGHYPDKHGAAFNDFNEHAEAVKWVNILKSELGVKAFVVPIGKLGDKVSAINKEPNIELAIEIHFNSALDLNGVHVGRGSETLYCPGSATGKVFAEKVQEKLYYFFPPNRGAKEGWYKMDKASGKKDYFLIRTLMPALIIEPDFVHRFENITLKRNVTCIALAKTFRKILENV